VRELERRQCQDQGWQVGEARVGQKKIVHSGTRVASLP
jgi:hypothetical protein